MQYYKESKEDVIKELNSSNSGLSSLEAKKRLNEFGQNSVEIKNNISKINIFISQFKSFIIYILLFAVALSVLIGEYVDAIIILIILLFNAIIGFFQELNAQTSLEALKKLTTISAKVYRNNSLIQIDSKQLVLGDVIFLEAGDKVPADARILDSNRLRVDESSLTGESLPVNKIDTTIDNELAISDRKNILFSSTSILEGSCKAIVIKTGINTQIGKITSMIVNTESKPTPLQIKLDKFGKNIGFIVIIITIIVFLISFIKEYLLYGFSVKAILDILLIAVSLAVAAVPTALPAVVTIALSIGVKRLLKKNSLVKNLSSVETLGSCDIICTDKTGTLTENQMMVKENWTLNTHSKFSGVGYNPQGNINGNYNNFLLEIGLVCNNSSLFKKDNLWKISGDPTEAALLVSAKKANIQIEYKKLDELSFDSNRKLMSVLILKLNSKQKSNENYIYTKGAFDQILNKCTFILDNNNIRKLTNDDKIKIKEINSKMGNKALRVLGFAFKKTNKNDNLEYNDENNLIFVGLQAMMDPARKDVIKAITKTKKAGIRTIMITGDHINTAVAIGKEIGILGNAVSGSQLDNMDDTELLKSLNENTNIFARVSPEHKQRIVKILQNQNHVVAMTGDGVNDAPALKKANIGIAVGSGTDVAKQAADFVLLDNSFSNIVNAIEEGRGIYNNIQKSIMLLLSGNLGEVLIIFLAVLFGLNLPLTAILLLWINLITDGAPALAFSVDPYSKNIMQIKPKKINESILPKKNIILISFLGIIGSIIGLILFYIFSKENLILGQTMIFNFVILYELFLVFIIRKYYHTKLFSNIYLWLSVILSLLLQLILMYTPISNIFHITPLSIINIIYLFLSSIIFVFMYLIYLFVENIYSKKNMKIIFS